MARTEHHPNGLIHFNPQLTYRGYTLFSSLGTRAYLMDMQGRFVHEWKNKLGIASPLLLPNGNLITTAMPSAKARGQRGLNGQAAGCFELDWDGNVVWRYDDPWIHHDCERLPNGNTLMLKWEPLPKRLVKRIRGGYHADGDDPDAMLGDVVIEVSQAGKVVSRWLSWNELDPATDEICPLDDRREWSHGNSIYLTPKGDWLISFRRISTVVRVNPSSGRIAWRFSDPTMSHQHDAQLTRDNTILLFDNGVHRRGIPYSRAIEVNPRTRKIVWEYADNPPFSLFTPMGGGVQRLPNGNTLITETAKGHFLEVTPDKKVVWEYVNPFFSSNPRMGGRINMVFRAHRYGPDHPALKGRDLDPERFANLNRLYGPGAD